MTKRLQGAFVRFSEFQQVLNKMLKSGAVFAGISPFSTSGMLKTQRYTPSIHSFNEVFNISSRGFHFSNCILFVTFCFPLFQNLPTSRVEKTDTVHTPVFIRRQQGFLLPALFLSTFPQTLLRLLNKYLLSDTVPDRPGAEGL